MKIAKIESLHADAGQRNVDFLKITTDDGLVGWSEYNESFGGLGVSAVIAGLAPSLNFNYKTEGFLKAARAMEPFDPVASCECLFGRRDYRPYFEHQSVDVAIVDTPWNGVAESLKIAAMADTYEVNVAPHNFYGHLATMMNAHFCALAPNVRIMEIDPDTVPWYDDLVTVKPVIADGHLHVPTGPGWGTEVNKDAVRAHPPRK